MVNFWKKYAVLLIAIAALAVWTLIACLITAHRVEKITREETQTEMEQIHAIEIEELTNKYENMLSDRQITAEMTSEVELIAKVLYGVRNNNENDLRTYAWCIFNRVDNKLYPNTIEEVVNQPQQWMAYSPDNAVVDYIYQIAMDEYTSWKTGHRPVTDDFVYMNWTPASITLRNNWKDGSLTSYWRFGK